MEGSGDGMKTNPFETNPSPETPSVFETTPSPETPSVFETNTAPAPQTITLSGSVSEFQPSNYGTTNAPGGRKMQWKQFFFGLVLPYAVVFLFTGIMFAVEEVGDPWEYDEKTLTVNENGYFTHDFQHSSAIEVEWCSGYAISPDADFSFSMYCSSEYSGLQDKFIVKEGVENPTGPDSYVEIGEYTPQNSTIWFQPTNSSIETIEIQLDFYDSSKDFDFVFEILSIGFCFLPFIYIGAVIFAFVKQKQSLAYGLLSALGLWIAIIALFIGSLLIFGF
jgi:hypothetical protein